MKIVIPFHPGDAHLAMDLLDWMMEIGPKKTASCLLVYPMSLSKKDFTQINCLTSRVFRYHDNLEISKCAKGWPAGPNQMFLESAKFIYESKSGPFLWLEPDSVPLKRGWYELLLEEYNSTDKTFMGSVNKRVRDGFEHLSGVAVYPEDAYFYWKGILPNNQAFDMINQDVIVPLTHRTRLIKNFWGEMNLAPTFKETRTKADTLNTLSLNSIPKDCCLFHRCKDSSLTSLLRKQDQKKPL